MESQLQFTRISLWTKHLLSTWQVGSKSRCSFRFYHQPETTASIFMAALFSDVVYKNRGAGELKKRWRGSKEQLIRWRGAGNRAGLKRRQVKHEGNRRGKDKDVKRTWWGRGRKIKRGITNYRPCAVQCRHAGRRFICSILCYLAIRHGELVLQ